MLDVKFGQFILSLPGIKYILLKKVNPRANGKTQKKEEARVYETTGIVKIAVDMLL